MFFSRKKPSIQEVLEPTKQELSKEEKTAPLYNVLEQNKEHINNTFNDLMSKYRNTYQDNADNVNLVMQGLMNRGRDIYGYGFNNNKTLQSLMYIIGQESIPPVGIYEYFLEMLVKNECLARKVLEMPIEKTFSEYNIVNTSDGWDIQLDTMKKALDRVYTDIINAIKMSELYGGCYIAITGKDIRVFQPSQLRDKSSDKMYVFNSMCMKRMFDTEWIKENKLEYIVFYDQISKKEIKVPYDKLVVLSSTKKCLGQFTKSELKGLGLSIFEGNLHYLTKVINTLNSIEEQILRQNIIVEKVKNMYATTQSASLMEIDSLKKGVATLGSIRTADGLVTDTENEVELLSGGFNIKDIMDYAVMKMLSICYNIPLKDLTLESAERYINTQTAEQLGQSQDTIYKMLTKNYQKEIRNILLLICNISGIEKTNLQNETIKLPLIFDDFTINFNSGSDK